MAVLERRPLAVQVRDQIWSLVDDLIAAAGCAVVAARVF